MLANSEDSSTSEVAIWGDNYVEADWFKGLSPTLRGADLLIIGPRGTNPVEIETLIAYDRPDIILTVDGKPKMVLEKTREVPTGHNVGQRVARLVRAVEQQVPTVKYFPFDAKKHGTFASMCNLNIRLLAAFRRMTEIHDVPVLAVNWPADDRGELLVDGTENEEIANVVDSFMKRGNERWWPEARSAISSMDREYDRRLGVRPAYGRLPPSAVVTPTTSLLDNIRASGVDPQILEPLLNRNESLLYKMEMTPEKCRREDPYTGTQFIYDYTECRTGPLPSQKSMNLVLWFPKLTKSDWIRSNPNDPGRKSSNWYLTANAMVFADGMDLLRTST